MPPSPIPAADLVADLKRRNRVPLNVMCKYPFFCFGFGRGGGGGDDPVTESAPPPHTLFPLYHPPKRGQKGHNGLGGAIF